MTLHAHSKLNLSLKMTILSLLAAGLLAGCGIRGSLKTPPPLFGDEAKVDPQRVPTDDLGNGDQDDYFDALGDEDFDSLDEDPLADL